MTIRDIEKNVSRLPARKLAAFRTWFYKFEARAWDKQFERDVNGGKLEALGNKAIRDFEKGHCLKPVPVLGGTGIGQMCPQENRYRLVLRK